MRTIDGPIDTVTIYRRSAVVVRRADVDLRTGTQDVEFVGLPLALIDASLRVEAEAMDAPQAGRVDVSLVRVGIYVAPKDDLPEPPDEVELRQVTRALEKKELECQLAYLERDSLRFLEPPDRPARPEGQPPSPSPLAARLALDEFASGVVRERNDEIQAIETELRELRRVRDDLLQRVKQASDAQRVQSQEVTKSAISRIQVGPGSSESRRVRITVQYLIPGVRWLPSYQVRVTGDRAQIVLRASVAQRSGEDWTGVHLKVSTAEPVSWTTLPRKVAQRIGRKQTFELEAGKREPPMGAAILFEDYDATRARLDEPTKPEYFMPLPRIVWTKPLAGAQGGPSSPPPVPAVAEGAAPVAKPKAPRRSSKKSTMAKEDAERAGSAVSEFAPEGVVMDEMLDASMDRHFEEASGADAPQMHLERTSKNRGEAGMRMRHRRTATQTSTMLFHQRAYDGFGGVASREVVAQSVFEAAVLDELVLQGPRQEERGSLARIQPQTYFEEMAGRAGRRLAFDLNAAIARARAEATAVSETPLPAHYFAPSDGSGHFDYTYPAHRPVDIPSDGALHSVPLSVREGECEITYVCVPRMDASVYRQARLLNPEPSPLLRGPAEIYVDGEYVLTASLPEVPGRGRFELGLGVEQSVRCARNVRFREARSSDKVVATNDLHHELRFVLANDLDRDVQCEVRERIPVPDEDAEVVVEERDVAPPWGIYTQEERQDRINGGRRWQVSIPKRGEVTLAATYVVRIYANHQIVGGNRRER